MNHYIEFSKLLYKIYDEKDIELNSPMNEHIYFKVGGPADILLTPRKKVQVVETIKLCKENNIPYIIIGNGSNLLVKDGGIRGVVIKISNIKDITVDGESITADCGALLADVSKTALEYSLKGFEFACGIPGSVGGAVFMNAGAYDGEISYIVESVEVINDKQEIITLEKQELNLGYRTSAIMEKGFIVLSATFSLQKGDYNQIKDRIEELTKKREEKQPLEYPSAGSTFKRPPGHFAGKLIQDAGLKGFTLGGAAVSEKHSGFVINKNRATAEDILNLIAHIQKTVKEKFDVELTPEVRILGEDKK
ncbi:UDP-N-acetylmuramate dehydrogenase [Clostridium fallax]|uniref:UDP-N-acetylenolpyruvoylglucosamine reductase n=1 Tax=Clostridium fallax TaxID=1533 RepID=A0A1M4VLP5_9CLOT|nr:UDP-N-acetylmuramate dehydrogenase [Clostridium fallax]SHE69752.1 UDP-N-acetylmuramate dehydrogenase [Clostridium fallax]SQB22779.1 UDP-N-acetylenolpyruvoylglucosamine reductase [Clostridium fallax]